ncbi:hypothetical protein [Capsulimonas corticalis]|uniref:hypothetical protein n=1 Tax=Capsulimonas corticalis TaxID=2219043 RepID=UPI002629A888|nr:hypothetical protein [Capsulimonas corticalis]
MNLRAYAVFEDHVSRIFPNASRRDTPAGESEYLVRMTGTQARVMDHALDLYDSVQRGEIAEVEEAISYSIRDTVLSTDPDTPEAIATRRAQFNNMAVLRSLLQGMRLLIPRQDDGDPRTMAARRASEMRQAIRQQFWSEHPERYGDAWDIVIESDQPLISIERIRKDTI